MSDDSKPTEETTATAPKLCSGVDCSNPVGTLQCPTCLKQGKEAFFCGQDCFKRSWGIHKKTHQASSEHPLLQSIKDLTKPTPLPTDPATGIYNPWPSYDYTGPLRPAYPLSPMRTLPESIQRPDYAKDGIPRSEIVANRFRTVKVLDEKQIAGMRKACTLGREVLDAAARAAKPGVTTDEIDRVVHEACIERDCYPSPLNYNRFPKSVCTSINECICHGIPDQRPLEDGDILNIDVSIYHGGFHADLNETYYIGEKAYNAANIKLVETSRQCLELAIGLVKPGMPYRQPGNIIEKHAKSRGLGTVRTYCGHGINTLFHPAPNIPHYAKNKAVGSAKPGVCFTIEPMINEGTWRDTTWPDDWTSTTTDGKRSAQFEHTLLVTADGVEILTARKEDSPGGPPTEEQVIKAGLDPEILRPTTTL